MSIRSKLDEELLKYLPIEFYVLDGIWIQDLFIIN